MEIIHTEKTAFNNSMVVNLETGKVKYFNCNIIVQLAACIIAVNV